MIHPDRRLNPVFSVKICFFIKASLENSQFFGGDKKEESVEQMDSSKPALS